MGDIRAANRCSTLSIALLLVMSGCAFFGLDGDDSVVAVECSGGTPKAEILLPGVMAFGSLTAEDPDTASSSCGGDGSGDRSYHFAPPQSGTYELRLYSDFDGVLYGVEHPCDGPRVAACVDDSGPLANEVLTVEVEAGVPYVVVVDGVTAESVGAFSLEAVLIASVGESESDGGTTCSEAIGSLDAGWITDRWMGTVSGSTVDASDQSSSTCGGGGAPDEAWRFVPPEAGVYRFALVAPEFDGLVTVRDASCGELMCDDGGGGSLPNATLEVLLGADPVDVVVDGLGGGSGAYELSVTQVLDSEVSPTCRSACADHPECGPDELCLSTTVGQICLPGACQTCFDQSLTCSSHPYTCEGAVCF